MRGLASGASRGAGLSASSVSAGRISRIRVAANSPRKVAEAEVVATCTMPFVPRAVSPVEAATGAPQRRSRRAIVIALGAMALLAALYMRGLSLVSMAGAYADAASSASGWRSITGVVGSGGGDHVKLRRENEELMRRIERLERDLKRKQEPDAAALAAAAAAAKESAARAQATQQASVEPGGSTSATASPHQLTPALIRSRCNAANIILITFVNHKCAPAPRASARAPALPQPTRRAPPTLAAASTTRTRGTCTSAASASTTTSSAR